MEIKDSFLNVWFGNFYCPAYDDKEFVKRTMKEIADLGFDSIEMDTKAWEDFRERYETGKLSQYVEMQEYMMKCAAENGLSHNFLALYLNGDNLYPRIRFSPPIFGEEIINRQGKPGRWYKYWSEKAQQSMEDHVRRIWESYGENGTAVRLNGKTVRPIISMWDPVVSVSFDEDGRQRYISFLKKRYSDFAAFEKVYDSRKSGFDELLPQDYWFTFRYDKQHPFSPEDVRTHSLRFVMWQDNAFWKMEEMENYFKEMQTRLKSVDPDFFLMPGMTQWGYFMNVDGTGMKDVDFCDLWDTAVRGIDIYRLSPYVDCTHFLSLPINPDCNPDAYANAYQHSMMRVMNEGRASLGGIYWGRYLYNDIYAFLTPAEIIGSIAASGAKGYSSYGVNGLDDGGDLKAMDESFLESLKTGNLWFKKVLKEHTGAKKKQAALLFPAAMAGIEPFDTEGNKERRLDSLGWYKILSDLGYQIDVIHMDGIERGCLKDYRLLVLPADDCYRWDRNPAAEEKIKSFVEDGGTLFHGPEDFIAEEVFGIHSLPCEAAPYFYDRMIIPQGISFARFEKGKALARFKDSEDICIAENHFGKGTVVSFGVMAGMSYTEKNTPHVPYEQKNQEMYPLSLSHTKLFEDLCSRAIPEEVLYSGHMIETGVFENGAVIVNHRSTPAVLPEDLASRPAIWQYPLGGGLLMPHSAVWIRMKDFG